MSLSIASSMTSSIATSRSRNEGSRETELPRVAIRSAGEVFAEPAAPMLDSSLPDACRLSAGVVVRRLFSGIGPCGIVVEFEAGDLGVRQTQTPEIRYETSLTSRAVLDVVKFETGLVHQVDHCGREGLGRLAASPVITENWCGFDRWFKKVGGRKQRKWPGDRLLWMGRET